MKLGLAMFCRYVVMMLYAWCVVLIKKDFNVTLKFIIMKKQFIFPLLIFLFVAFFPRVSFGQFAELVRLNHSCNGAGGSVAYELTGDPNQYTYYWEHGATDLALFDLPPGIYTLIVQDIFGCTEEFEVEILGFTGCMMSYQVQSTFDPCVAEIRILVTTTTGYIIDQAALNIEWEDGSNAGLNRLVPISSVGEYCVTITTNSENPCCLLNECISVRSNPNCGQVYKCDKDVIVNEINRNTDGRGQYVEILVTGKCECDKTIDLRGLILDDNNGLLIPANETVNPYNLEESIGANAGYLVFSNNPIWSAVPTGSLILIHDETDEFISNFPSDDPTDSDGDGLYVLQADNSDFFYAKTGSWNQDTKLLEYSGGLDIAEWERIRISEHADGIQLRMENGDFHHGISQGETNLSVNNDFALWLGDVTNGNRNCQLIGSDFSDPNDYDCFEPEALLQTPGMANSIMNARLRDTLLSCDETIGTLAFKQKDQVEMRNALAERLKENINIFPNPFSKSINIDFTSIQSGKSNCSLISTSGQSILNQKILTKEGSNTFELNVEKAIPSGLYFLKFTFPSGFNKTLRLVHVGQD